MSESRFGQCCNDLLEALTADFNRLFHTDERGVLRVAVGYVVVEDRQVGWFDNAVLFCPFCGAQLQTRSEIAASVGTN
jgi:hypothetical protein